MAHEILSAAIAGIDAQSVRVQIDSNPGIHSFSIVGLGDKAVQESIDRIGSAIKHSGFIAPNSKNKRFVVNLAPADIKKEGPGYDLPVSVAYLSETKQINPRETYKNTLFIGELGLDGKLAHTNGILAAATLAKSLNLEEIVVPACNAQEASAIDGIKVIGAETLAQVLSHLEGKNIVSPTTLKSENRIGVSDDSFAYIKGQMAAKRALMVAAAGGHNILMSGTPGSGKTLLARSLVGLLPPLTRAEALEVAKIYSSVGLLRGSITDLNRPFCSPHHTASPASIVGGGAFPRPGQMSLAHRGVLFLDELPEFARNVLEAMRQPLEDGVVTISRASGSLILPAKFMLVGAMNPCPCGNYGDPAAICTCSTINISKYSKKISGPLLDRMDIQIHVSREQISDETHSKPDDIQGIRASILSARLVQAERFGDSGLVTNSDISHKNIDNYCKLSPDAEKLIRAVINQNNLSLRAYHRIKKIARTIADLDASEVIKEAHIAEAMALRINDRTAKYN